MYISQDIQLEKAIYSEEDESAYKQIICKSKAWIGAQVHSASAKYSPTLNGQYLLVNSMKINQDGAECPFSDLL